MGLDLDRVALELYTVREPAATDFPGTLKQVADMGYRAVELAGLHGMTAAGVKQTLDDLGLRAMAAHISLDRFATDTAGAIAEAQTLGCDLAIVPFVPPERRTAEATRAMAAAFNDYATQCQAAGLRFGYHNHAFEFEPLADGATLLDLLLDGTDPALVNVELDVYWVAYANQDPLALIERLAGRLPILHLKDMEAGPNRADAPVGSGTIEWEPILAAGAAAGVDWYVTEQDNPADPLEDAAASLRYLQQLA